MANGPEREDGPGQGQVLTVKKTRQAKPPMYAVVLLNDDYTPMEFVVWILRGIFHKTEAEATKLMLQIHNHGRGVCGIYTHDVARSKAAQVENVAKRAEHPLACIIEACGTDEGK